ncbi:DUF4184 family protein [Paenibacillus thailandensis]|uniref:DUF4184 family protein n=1 Tax=Paenibacillus thailandensis TaxID=393250 RepID=A0ABW5R225_9BACL
MPFTLSHPLYAVPLRKLIPALSATGLALGSMMPDMEYFIAMQPVRTNGHTLAGFILNGIPLCTALAYAFHRIVMSALPYLLPSAGGLNRFAADCRSDWSLKSLRSFISFYVSLFIGFLSHLFVDGWTHRTGFYVNMFPSLRKPVVAGFPGYWLLQQSLSVIGLLLPLLYLFVLWRSWSKGENASASRRQVQPGSFMPYLPCWSARCGIRLFGQAGEGERSVYAQYLVCRSFYFAVVWFIRGGIAPDRKAPLQNVSGALRSCVIRPVVWPAANRQADTFLRRHCIMALVHFRIVRTALCGIGSRRRRYAQPGHCFKQHAP